MRYILAYNLGLQKFLAEFFQKKKPSWSEFFVRDHETIIYRLIMRNPRNDAYFPFLIFSCHWWREKERGRTMGEAGKRA